ncbi:MAG: response regulator transcription factor [Saprospiraceae bacterium]|nr:response regulator transcription factor [Saprospiraceae bacterium]
MKAIILEDEIIAQNRLKRQLGEIDSNIEILHCFESVSALAEYLLNNAHPDLLLLDINVEDGSSFELFDLVDIDAHIIFTTAYAEYAIEAFNKNAIHYLLKPIKLKALSEALLRASKIDSASVKNIKEENSTYSNRFLIRFGSRLHTIEVDNIAYIYSQNKISYFITNDGERIASDFKLQDLALKLDPDSFFRANRQFIVSRKSVSEILISSRSRLEIRLNPPYKDQIIISTERTPKFKDWLKGS